MARRGSRRKGTGLIPRYNLPGVHRTVAKDTSGPWDNTVSSYSFENLVLDNCTLQTLSPRDLEVLQQGLSFDTTFTMFTNTPVYVAQDGEDFIGSSVYIPNIYFSYDGITPAKVNKGGWYTVVSAAHYGNDVINHCEAVIVKDTKITDQKGLSQYPDTSGIDPFLTTREQLFNGSWEDTWLGVVP